KRPPPWTGRRPFGIVSPAAWTGGGVSAVTITKCPGKAPVPGRYNFFQFRKKSRRILTSKCRKSRNRRILLLAFRGRRNHEERYSFSPNIRRGKGSYANWCTGCRTTSISQALCKSSDGLTINR